MTVSTIATIAAGIAREQSNQASKPSAALSALLPQSTRNNATDVANLSAAITLQNQVAQFKVVSKEVAQAGSLLSAAEAGASEIAQNLTRLKDLATRAASPTLSDDERASLDTQFQSIRTTIGTIAKNTTFNGESLLDGTSTQLTVTSDAGSLEPLSVGSLTDSVLFGDATIRILNPSGAKVVQGIVGTAIEYVAKQIDNINTLQQGLDFASATLQSAIQNKDAANSTLSADDLVLQGLIATPNNDAKALFAQTNKLPTNLLQLLSE